jgi:hypothetical protein
MTRPNASTGGFESTLGNVFSITALGIETQLNKPEKKNKKAKLRGVTSKNKKVIILFIVFFIDHTYLYYKYSFLRIIITQE